MGDVAITELKKLDVTRIDAVDNPANGFPVLIMKAVAKGQRDCPKCDKSYDADHQGDNCENCGTKLPVAKAAGDGEDMEGADSDGVIVEDGKPCPTCGQAVDGTIVRAHVRHKGAAKAGEDMVKCPTCKGDGKIRGNSTDCPDCKAKGEVTPAKRDSIMGKSLGKVIAGAGPGINWDWPLLLKAVGADGQVDEQPDIDTGDTILHLIGQAIAYEAQELMHGGAGELRDIIELAYAGQAIQCWRDGEQAVALGDLMPASMLMQAAKAGRDFSAGERQTEAGQGNALPDGSYPIPDADALRRAAILARSGHGDVAAAKELGVANPLDEETSKSQIAPEGTTVDTDHGTAGQDAPGGDVAGLTKALAASQERTQSLEAELAKVKATPVPGGPMMTAVSQRKQADGTDHAAKARYYDEMADRVSDPSLADDYRTLAAQARKKIPAE